MFFPVAGDPYYSSVGLLLPMTGANEGTTFIDVSPSPKTVTRYNAITSTAQSKWGNSSGYFDGTGDYLTVPHDSSLLLDGDFTLEWYFRLSSTASIGTYPRILAKSEDGSGGFVVFYPSSSICYIKFNGTTSIQVGTLTLNNWSYMAVCRSGTTITTFLNGEVTSSGTVSGTIGGTNNIYIGASSNLTSGYYAAGYLQDLRITKGVARYTTNFTVPDGPLPPRTLESPVHRRIVQQPSHRAIARLGL